MDGEKSLSTARSLQVKSMSRSSTLKEDLRRLPELATNCCIYKVPERLRQINEKAYTPQVVSIGPLHHGREDLMFMEEHKQRYLQDFLQRSQISMEQIVNLITEKEDRLRGCYAAPFKLKPDEFVRVILIDATFIIEVLLRYTYPKLRNERDYIFRQPYFIQDIWYDMWLLENQIPFFILEDLFNIAKGHYPIPDEDSVPDKNPTILKLTYEYFKSLEVVHGKLYKFTPETGVQHFTDFLRICLVPLHPRDTSERKITNVVIAPSAIQLHQAGVNFGNCSSNELLDINFKKGTLEIPRLKLQLETESLFRNLIAFEQRHYLDNYINDYVFILHHLLNSPKDVELLVEKGIIDNWLPDKESVSTLINKLSSGTTLFPDNFYFSRLCEDLKNHCEDCCNKSWANLRQNYFNTPWSGISVIGAVFLIILTLKQTACSVIQVLSQPKNC